MKPPPFLYLAPQNEQEALDAIDEHGFDALIIAGGQSLVPMMNARLAAPAVLVDINGIPGWSYIRTNDDGVAIGALTRHAEIEDSAEVAEGWPVVLEAVRYLAHRAVRNRGTLGGTVALAYPGAELPAMLVALDAQIDVLSRNGRRSIPAGDFFLGQLETALESGELVHSVRLPRLPAGAGGAFTEISRRHGDFALAAASSIIVTDAAGRVSAASLCVTGGTPVPFRLGEGERILIGEVPSQDLWRAAAEDGLKEAELLEDAEYSADHRRAMLAASLERTMMTAAERASHAGA